ncbi:MAG: SPFH domain-containing protein [Candidatus Obscuribacterales bacterium]
MLELIFLVLALASICVAASSKQLQARVGGFVGFFLFGSVFIMTSVAVVVEPGNAGIVFNRMGGIEKRVLPSGLQFVIPLVETVIQHDVRTQRISFQNEEAVSSDQQVIHTDVTLNFHPKINELWMLYSEVGLDYGDKIVGPVVREALKAEIAKHKVDDLLANRAEVSQNIRSYVMSKLAEKHLEMEMISLTNVRFSQEYQAAVEQKQVALQNAQAMRNTLEKAKVEADITRTKADAEAYQIQAVQKALGASPDFVKLEAVRKLNPNAQIIYVPHGTSVLVPGTLPGSSK